MKKLILSALLAVGLATSALAADVGVSVHIAQPGVYGRIEIGNLPVPQVVYQQPVVIAPAPVVIDQQPIYLYVPAVEARNWGRYCGRYNTCGRPVYFVQETWYRDVYVPMQRGRHHEHDDDNDDEGQRGNGHGHRGHNGHDD